MPYGLPSSFRAIAILTLLAMVGAPVARAETLTIQGSSTASTTLLAPNQATIEALSRQSLKIVGIRSDLGVLRLLARQAEFAVISSSLKQVVDSLRTNSPDLPYDKLAAFPVSQVRVAFAVNPNNPVRTADMASIRRVLSGELTKLKKLGGAVESNDVSEYGKADVELDGTGALFHDLGAEQVVWMSHRDSVTAAPAGARVTASSETTPIAAFEPSPPEPLTTRLRPVRTSNRWIVSGCRPS